MSSNGTDKLGRDFRTFAHRLERYLRLEATERLTVLTTYVILAAIVFALATSAIFFLSTGLVKSLALVVGSEMTSYYIVGAFLVLLIVLVILCKQRLIERKVLKKFSDRLLDTPTFAEHYMGGEGSAAKSDDAKLKALARALVQEMHEEKGGEQ